jgi:hypothetical protein
LRKIDRGRGKERERERESSKSHSAHYMMIISSLFIAYAYALLLSVAVAESADETAAKRSQRIIEYNVLFLRSVIQRRTPFFPLLLSDGGFLAFSDSKENALFSSSRLLFSLTGVFLRSLIQKSRLWLSIRLLLLFSSVGFSYVQ